MTRVDLMNVVTAMLQQYELTNNEIVGCALMFEAGVNPPKTPSDIQWHGYQFNGKKFHDGEKIEIRVIK